MVALPFCVGLAWLLARFGRSGAWWTMILDAGLHLPLVLPPVVTGWLLLLAFGAQGPVGRLLADLGVAVMFRWTGAALAAGVMAVPLMVRSMRLSLEAVDPSWRRRRGHWRGTMAGVCHDHLPLAMPGVLAGLVLGFARSLGNLARRSPSSRTFRARRRPCRWPSIPLCRRPMATRW
jgi:molybdate transport system permease protein